jgi:hypothetical protein
MTQIDEVKLALRVSSTAFDAEIESIIAACKRDLSMAGVKMILDGDPLIRQAIKLYAKANFGYDESSEKFTKAYESLKNSMSLSGDYNLGG